MKATDWYSFYGVDFTSRKKRNVRCNVRAADVVEVVQAAGDVYLHTKTGSIYQLECTAEESTKVYEQIVEFLTIE
jgi:hypothetical protein